MSHARLWCCQWRISGGGVHMRPATDGRTTRRPVRGALIREVPLLAELPESQASGQIAEIYREIRVFSGVPYVSSLQRYLATLPGVLEWAWTALRPAMVSGVIPETGWRRSAECRLAPAVPVPAETLRAWGARMGLDGAPARDGVRRHSGDRLA